MYISNDEIDEILLTLLSNSSIERLEDMFMNALGLYALRLRGHDPPLSDDVINQETRAFGEALRDRAFMLSSSGRG